jgi:hypothetical protein
LARILGLAGACPPKPSATAGPAIAGLIDTAEKWIVFGKKWKRILDSYNAPFFHFREFASKHLCAKPNSPYYGWSEGKRHSFLYDLAIHVGDSAVPMGGAYAARRNSKLGLPGNGHKIAICSFFDSLIALLNSHWPQYDGKALLILDHSTDRTWTGLLHEVHSQYLSKDKRIGGLSFEDDKDPKHLPLQAADLSAYIFRQFTEKYVESEGKESPPSRLLDFILNMNLDPFLWNMDRNERRRLVRCMCEDEKRKMALWKSQGITQKYLPLDHFPFEQYDFKIITKRNSIWEIPRLRSQNHGGSEGRN